MDLEKLYARTMRNSTLALVASALFLLMGDPPALVAGFMVGTAAGMWNAHFLVRRFNRAAGLPVDKGKAVMLSGMVTRLPLIVAVLALAGRLPQYFNLLSTAAGLFVVPLIALFIAAGWLVRERLTSRSSA